MEYNVGNVTISFRYLLQFQYRVSFFLRLGSRRVYFFSSRFFHTFSTFENIKVVSFNETSSKYDRYLIAFLIVLRRNFDFSFFFYALASLLLFATREIISRFEREEYFSVTFSWTRLDCSCYRGDSFVRILFIVEIEIVRGGLDRISMEILLHGIDCIYLYYIRWYKNIE